MAGILLVILTTFSIVTVWFETVRAGIVYAPYQFGDFLVTYSGGFVRRGAIGTIFKLAAHGQSVLLAFSVYTFAAFLLLVFALFFLVFYRAKFRLQTLLLVGLMPGGYVQMSLTREFMFRKEFGFIALLAVFACLYISLRKRLALEILAYAVGVFCMLSHESFAFLVAPAFALLLYGLTRSWKTPAAYMGAMLMLFAVLTTAFHGSPAQVATIWQHTLPQDRVQGMGSLGTIGLSFRWEAALIQSVLLSGYTWWYIGPVLLVSAYCWFIVWVNDKETSWVAPHALLLIAAMPMFLLGVRLGSMDRKRGVFVSDRVAGDGRDIRIGDHFSSFEASFRKLARPGIFWLLLAFTVTFRLPELFISLRFESDGPKGFLRSDFDRAIHLVHRGNLITSP